MKLNSCRTCACSMYHWGLLINFHVVLLKDGTKRLVNNYAEPDEELGIKKLLTAKVAKVSKANILNVDFLRGLCDSLAIFAVKGF